MIGDGRGSLDNRQGKHMSHEDTVKSRRRMLGTLAAFGGAVLVSPMRSAFAQDALPVTPSSIMGPFYPIVRPLDADMDLTTLAGKQGRALGQVIHVTGRVLGSDGKPVSGATIELWQANSVGRYAHPSDVNTAPLDPNFQGFARQVTDAEGRYRFKTIKPGAYPINPANPTSVRTPHLHFDVMGLQNRLLTQMYFPGEALNATDSIFNQMGSRGDRAIARVLPPTEDMAAGELLLGWDIILARG